MQAPTAAQQKAIESLAAARLDAEKAFEPVRALLKTKCADWEARAPTELLPLPVEHLVAHYDFENRLVNAAADAFHAHEVGTSIKFEPGLSGMAATFDGTQHAEAEAQGMFDPDQPWTVTIGG